MKLNIVQNIECLEGVKNVKNKSIDLVFCDLPFGETQNSWDKIIAFDNGICEKKGKHHGRYWADLANERIEQFKANTADVI